MFANMEKDRALASLKRSADSARAVRPAHRKEETPGARNAWTDLVSSITYDLSNFNNHRERAGQTAASIRAEYFQCEIYIPGMHSKRLVLTLDNSNLQVVVHPEFPKQHLSINVAPDEEGQPGFWQLGVSTRESARLSTQQLSEYLLKPILSAAAINTEL